jgi:hypothetical protein
MRHNVLRAAGFAIVLGLVACNQSIASVPTPAITVVTALPPASPTPLVCSENPAGLTLDVQTGGFYRVRVIGRGFKPGERLLLVFTAKTATHSTKIEARPVQGVNADGTFSWDETLTPPTGAEGSAVTWNVAIVHSRGVACTQVKVL